jgi:hypothetical protein
MVSEQCWALDARRARCAEPVVPSAYFCGRHGAFAGRDPIDIFCLPEAEMPPALVAAIRARCPTWPFPQPSPPIFSLGSAALDHAFAPRPSEDRAEPVPAPTPCEPVATETESEPLAWLQTALRQAIEAVMAADAQPVRKANTVARLGSLYLRAYRATDLQHENRRLRKRVATLETSFASMEAALQEISSRLLPAARIGTDQRAAGGRRTNPTPTVPPMLVTLSRQTACPPVLSLPANPRSPGRPREASPKHREPASSRSTASGSRASP